MEQPRPSLYASEDLTWLSLAIFAAITGAARVVCSFQDCKPSLYRLLCTLGTSSSFVPSPADFATRARILLSPWSLQNHVFAFDYTTA